MRAIPLFIVFAFSAVLTSASPAAAQVINCRNPQSADEAQICRVPELYEINDRILRRYYRLRSELRGGDLYRLQADQHNWRNARRRCHYDTRCIYEVSSRRLEELRGYRRYR